LTNDENIASVILITVAWLIWFIIYKWHSLHTYIN